MAAPDRDRLRDILENLWNEAEFCATIHAIGASEHRTVSIDGALDELVEAMSAPAAEDGHACPECHMVERCKMSCSRGGSKGARVSVPLIQSDPLTVTIRRISADEHEPDRLDIDVRRGELRVLSTEVYRGELLHCDADITVRERHQIGELLLNEWSAWSAPRAKREEP